MVETKVVAYKENDGQISQVTLVDGEIVNEEKSEFEKEMECLLQKKTNNDYIQANPTDSTVVTALAATGQTAVDVQAEYDAFLTDMITKYGKDIVLSTII